MSKPIQDAYIVAATRTPIGRSHKGYFRNTRPDDLLATVLRSAMAQVPNLDPAAVAAVLAHALALAGEQGSHGIAARVVATAQRLGLSTAD